MSEAGWPDEPRALGVTGDVGEELYRLERQREREEQEQEVEAELEAIDAVADAEVENAQRETKRARDVDLDDGGDDEDDGGAGMFTHVAHFMFDRFPAFNLKLPCSVLLYS